MRVDCPAKTLLAALKRVQPAALKNKHHPVLACVLIEAEPGWLTLSAANGEFGVKVRLAGAETVTPARVAVSAERLAAVLGEAGSGPVALETAGELLRVRADGARFELPTFPVAEFPEIPTPGPDAPALTLPADEMRRLIRHTAFAASRNDSAARFAMAGVLFELGGQTLTLVGTDAKRLAVDSAAVEAAGVADSDPKRPTILPVRLLGIVEDVLPEGQDPVRVVLRPSEAHFRAAGCAVWTRLVEGRFPPWRDILPRSHKGSVTLPADGFARKLRQAAIMADREASRVDATFAPEKIRLQARGAQTGESDVWLDGAYSGPAVSVGFDPHHVAEFLGAADAEEVAVELSGPGRPVLFRAGDAHRYVVMPLV